MQKNIPTLKEIARRLKVSISTVSRALHDHPTIGLRTKMQVQKLAKELNYEPNQTAIFLKQRKTMTIGVVLPSLKEDFFSQAINGIEDVAKKNNYSVLIGQSHDDGDQEKQIVAAMRKQRVDGLVVSLAKHTKDTFSFAGLGDYGIPCVFFDRVPADSLVHKVSSNIAKATKEAILFLVTKGHKKIGIINGPQEMTSTRERTDSYMEVLKKKKIKIDLSLIASTDFTQKSTWSAMESLLNRKQRPTAIVTINDYVALDAIDYAKKAKLKINKDICFVSHANVSLTNYLQTPPLASVEQYPYEQSRVATEILFNLINENSGNGQHPPAFNNVLIEGKLVVHKT